jgi:hypothetical protein
MAGRRAGVFGAVALAVSLFGADDAAAFVHVVRTGESLAHIASRVYGDSKRESVLAGANFLDVQGGSAIVAGMRLELPAPGHHRCAGGETWAALAQDWLGDAKRAEVLARENGGVSWIAPTEGQEVRIPYVLTHLAASGDTTAGLANRYLADPNLAWLLDGYNGRKDAPLVRGEVVLVPLLGLSLTAEGRNEAAESLERARTETAGTLLDTQRKIEADLPALQGDVRGGRYIEAIGRGNRLLGTGEPTRAQLAVIHRALLEAYVALDATPLAVAACAAWRANEPSPKLDPVYVSPKIRVACGR